MNTINNCDGGGGGEDDDDDDDDDDSVVYTISSTNSVMLYSVNTRNARLTGILLNFLGLISYD